MNVRLDPRRDVWMAAAEARRLIGALTANGGEARFVGGAVRNALLKCEVDDVDIATPLVPEEVARRLKAAGIEAVPTGIEHGTITAVVDGKPFEVTTLRRDVTTDGRRATVAFTTDWREDAARRDFTINALYAAPDGEIFDYFGGLSDLENGRVRFVGDATMRIREDYLRILRLFRFHAWYGRGEIDQGALRAAAAEKSGLANLSGERIQKEMLKLLGSNAPAPVLRTMAAAGMLGELLPGPLFVARVERLSEIDSECFFQPDPLLRLAALLPADPERVASIAERWRLSGAQRSRLDDIVASSERIVSYLSPREMRQRLYRMGPRLFKDIVFLRWADDPKMSNGVQWRALLAHADAWQPPKFPLTGRDVMLAGVPEGPLVGKILAEVESWWVDSDFIDDSFSLAERLKSVVQAMAY
jgi:poly(A) polymerase